LLATPSINVRSIIITQTLIRNVEDVGFVVGGGAVATTYCNTPPCCCFRTVVMDPEKTKHNQMAKLKAPSSSNGNNRI
jgi:hypothetical protein